MHCLYCENEGGMPMYSDEFLRVVLVPEPDYPGFCRVILKAHVCEMSDLDVAERIRVMRAVFAVEEALREVLKPDKVNLASLGNQVPHLHWHVIPRFADDAHFPDPVWGQPKRPAPDREEREEELPRLLMAVEAKVSAALSPHACLDD